MTMYFELCGPKINPVSEQTESSSRLSTTFISGRRTHSMQRSLCRPRRSRDCMRTSSSWPPRLTAYSLGRPRRERVLVVLQLAPCFDDYTEFGSADSRSLYATPAQLTRT